MAKTYEVYPSLPATFFYSLILSFIFLNYYSRKKENCRSWIIFIIAIIHLALIFTLPVVLIISLMKKMDDFGDIYFKVEPEKSAFIIKIVQFVNHGLNKLIYPLCIVYYESGFISLKYKIFPISCKAWFHWLLELWIVPIVIILGILFFPFQKEILDFYDNVFVYFLNYLNIYDLICLYYELGFSIFDSIRYFFRICCKKEIHKKYIKGKLIYLKRKRSQKLKEEFKKLDALVNLYSDEIRKYHLSEINTFLSKHENFIDKTSNSLNEVENESSNEQKDKIENISQMKLEKLVYPIRREIKQLRRKITRIDNLYQRIIIEQDKIECCNCINSNDAYKCCEITRSIFYFILCLYISLFEYYFYITYKTKIMNKQNKQNNTFIYSNFTLQNQNSTNNNTTPSVNVEFGRQFFDFFYLYFNVILYVFISTGIYFIPMLYSIVRRRFITGEYIYAKGFSNNLEIIKSVQKISSLVSASLYLGVLFTILYLKEDSSLPKYSEFFKIFNVPFSNLVIIFKYVFLILVMFFSNFEFLNFRCFKVYIADDGNFYLDKFDFCSINNNCGRKAIYNQLAEEENINAGNHIPLIDTNIDIKNSE